LERKFFRPVEDPSPSLSPSHFLSATLKSFFSFLLFWLEAANFPARTMSLPSLFASRGPFCGGFPLPFLFLFWPPTPKRLLRKNFFVFFCLRSPFSPFFRILSPLWKYPVFFPPPFQYAFKITEEFSPFSSSSLILPPFIFFFFPRRPKEDSSCPQKFSLRAWCSLLSGLSPHFACNLTTFFPPLLTRCQILFVPSYPRLPNRKRRIRISSSFLSPTLGGSFPFLGPFSRPPSFA